jgi:hypothetical protein
MPVALVETGGWSWSQEKRASLRGSAAGVTAKDSTSYPVGSIQNLNYFLPNTQLGNKRSLATGWALARWPFCHPSQLKEIFGDCLVMGR